MLGALTLIVDAVPVTIGEADFEGAPSRGSVSLPPWRRGSSGAFGIGIESYSSLGSKSDAVPGAGNYCHYQNGASESIYQVLSTSLVANATYRLSVVAIDRSDQTFQSSELRMGYVPGTDDGTTGDMIANHFYGVYLLTATVLTNTIPLNGAAPDDGYITWVSDFKVESTHPGVGSQIRIEIVGSGIQSLFDNVTLEMIPGPAAGTLIVIR